ncbi:MAG: M28 family peptidase, partial [Acidobacteria bacterium]|nr:M28 family peptidase [Acidobacteriota bacterium]
MVILNLPFIITFRYVQVIVDDASPRFSAARAFDTTREFVTQFPMRRFGSLESRQSTGYLSDKLTAMGYEEEYINYDGRIGGGQQAGRNVLAYKQGETDEIIAVTAHFDTARPTIQGAAKNGAAVGVLMELAELFSGENTRRSLLFAFTDGGEWGSTGAKDLTLNYEKKDRIAAVLTLDYVVPGDLAGFRMDTIGQLGGAAPFGLRKLAEDVAGELTPSVPVKSGGVEAELLEKAFMISRSEQGPFLKAGIPAINLGSFSTDRKREKAILHSSEDKVENLKIETIDKYGRVAEQIVRSLAKSPEIPPFSDKLSMMSGTVRQICILTLSVIGFAIPLLHIRDSRKILNLAQMGRELTAFLAAWFPFLVLFLGIRLAYAARRLPFYDLYPAIAKDPVMQNPPWKVFAIIVAGVLFAAIAVWIIARYFLKEWIKPDYRNSCAALWIVLFVTMPLAVAYNLFWPAVFFIAPAVLWPMPQSGKNAE